MECGSAHREKQLEYCGDTLKLRYLPFSLWYYNGTCFFVLDFMGFSLNGMRGSSQRRRLTFLSSLEIIEKQQNTKPETPRIWGQKLSRI
ncbi:hypothetical protein M9H77_35585 [Catharanthus roseus]|uniref:Uncharacterized protein n=1 Tax=Catharanthus roseus TaxID=4058 RepID=A0ACB9ZPQ0_CATRO|nr:hypothetical protein M9H77_35585 [Catharanthus roseus]